MAALSVRPARGAEYFAVLALRDLPISSGGLPSAGTDSWNRYEQRRARTLHPTVTLETGEPASAVAYLDLPEGWRRGTSDPRDILLAVRTSKLSHMSGRVDLPKNDLSGMQSARFTLPASAFHDDADARRRFHAVEERHYRRLLDEDWPGAAWFRQRMRQARIAQGLPADGSATSGGSLIDTFSLLAPERGLSERLSLRAAELPEADQRSQPIASLRDVAPSGSFTPPPRLPRPPLDPLAARVPHDQYAIYFPTFDDMLRGIDEWDLLGADLMSYFLGHAGDRQIGHWYQRQMCIELTVLDRLLGPTLIASVAMTGSDPYLDVGSDVAVLFEAKNAAGLETFLRGKQQAAKMAMPGVEDVQGVEDGVTYVGVRSTDRRISSYLFTIDGTVIAANSVVQMRRIVAASKNQPQAMASSPEYAALRQRHPRGQETALLVVPSTAIRIWLSPRVRIGSSRRTRAAAQLAQYQCEAADDLVAGRIEAAGRTITNAKSTLGSVTAHPQGVRSSVYGTLEFQTPISELDLSHVSPAEASAYEHWRTGFEKDWSGLLVALAAQITIRPDRISATATTLPRPSHPLLDLVARVTGTADAPLATKPSGQLPATDPSTPVLQASISLDTRAELWRNLGQFVDLYLGISAAHRAVGPRAEVTLAESPFWAQFAAAADPLGMLRTGKRQPPVALHVAAADANRLRQALLSFHRQERALFGRGFAREVREHAGAEYYLTEGGLLGDAVPPLYQFAGPKGFVVSPNEELARHAIAASRSTTAESKEQMVPLGTIEMTARREGLEAAESLLSTDVDRTAAARSWSSLPILDEWQRRFPAEKAVFVQQRLWYTKLTCPGGGTYAPVASGRTESTVFGSPAEPKERGRHLSPLAAVSAARFSVAFEKDAISMNAVLERGKPKP